MEPNPIWGLHLVPGEVVAALVHRNADGAFELREAFVEPAPEEVADVVRVARDLLGRRGLRGRAAFLALPDTSGCLVTATVPPEELDLTEQELVRDLFDHTPFDPEQGESRHRLLRREGRRQEFLVAALPRTQVHRFLEVLAEKDTSLAGAGFAASAMVRGARALGLAPAEGCLVEMHPRVTMLYGLDGEHVRRYLLPIGEDELIASAAAAMRREPASVRDEVARGGEPSAALVAALAAAVEPLAHDLLTTAEYHRVQHRRMKPSEEPPRADVVAVGRLGARPALLAALRRTVDTRLAPASNGLPAATKLTIAPGARLPSLPIAALAGAVGAAVEAFALPAERLALRPPPADVPEVRESRPFSSIAAWVAAALVLVAIAVGGFFWWQSRGGVAPHPVEPAADRDALAEFRRDLALAAQRAAFAEALVTVAEALGGAPGELVGRTLQVESLPDGYAVHLVAGPASGSASEADANAAQSYVQARLESDDAVVYPTVRWEARRLVAAWRTTRRPVPAGAGTDDPDLRRVLSALAPDAMDPPQTDREMRTTAVEVLPALAAAARRLGAGTYVTRARVDGAETGEAAKIDVAVGAWAQPAHPAGAASPGSVEDFARAVLAALAAEPARIAFQETPAPETSPALVAEPAGAGRVRLRWNAGAGQGAIERSGRAGDPDAGTWTRVAAGPDASELIDEVPGASGVYRWRWGGGVPVELRVDVPVTADLAGAASPGGEGARFLLRRAWRGDEVTASVDVPLGGRISASARAQDGQELVLDTGLKLRSVRSRIDTATRTVRVPRFLPDGRVERSAEGAAATSERALEEAQRVFEAEGVGPDGTHRTWSRKMTDG